MRTNVRNANVVCVFDACSRWNRRGTWNVKSPKKAAIRLNSGLQVKIHYPSHPSSPVKVAHVIAFAVPVSKGDP